ncbi:hypothetical protein [Aurantiacibacter rhizosphaerae]|uniref:hypothetical protein n=1 Tax=Aurantiacibacter rhizosphaerae TaxID=2691582 RepID=UPI0019229BB5|nr:hypothetical protein [Aurantiacibacter rhizosphaerae]
MPSRIAIATTMLFAATPAAARDVAQVSEASSLTLLAMGVAGVLIGRSLSMRRKDED